ncbi:MAG: hypothetical protein R3E87_25815 [Burkholderiaceae bacterium]
MLTVLVTDVPAAAGLAADAALRRVVGQRPLETRTLAAIDDLRRTSLEHWLSERFALPDTATVAAYARLAVEPEPITDGGDWVLSPVHLQATTDHLVLHAAADLALDPADAQALADTANAHFAADGFVLRPLTAQLWSLAGAAELEALALASSAAARGRNVDHYMPRGDHGRRARALLNEVQMLWHDHPVNEARAERGLPAVNSLWIEGRAVPVAPRPFATVLSNDDRLTGLGLASGARIAGLPEPPSLASALSTATVGEATLCQIDAGDDARLRCILASRWPETSRIVLVERDGWQTYPLQAPGLAARLRRWLAR